MRMPIFSYFLVMGTLLGVFLWIIGNAVEPVVPEIQSSPAAGLPQFKGEPESEHAHVTTVNFAAVHNPATKPLPTAAVAAPRKNLSSMPRPTSWTQTAEYPHDRLTIH
jgi:hypothetical protein